MKNELDKSGRLGARKDFPAFFPRPPRFRARFVPISLAPAYLGSISSSSFSEKAADNRVYHIPIAWNRITRIMVLNKILVSFPDPLLERPPGHTYEGTPDMDVDVAVERKFVTERTIELISTAYPT